MAENTSFPSEPPYSDPSADISRLVSNHIRARAIPRTAPRRHTGLMLKVNARNIHLLFKHDFTPPDSLLTYFCTDLNLKSLREKHKLVC